MALTNLERRTLRFLGEAGHASTGLIHGALYGPTDGSARRYAARASAIRRTCKRLSDRGHLQMRRGNDHGRPVVLGYELTEQGRDAITHEPRFDTSVCLDPEGCRHTTYNVGESCECCGRVIRASRGQS